MAEFEFDFDEVMPASLKSLLVKLVQMSKNIGSLSFWCVRDVNQTWHYNGGRDGFEIPFEEGDENPHFSLEQLELIRVREIVTISGNTKTSHWILFLTPKAYRWYQYHSANIFNRWWIRNKAKSRDFILGISFILSLFLTVLQIFGLTISDIIQRLFN